MNIVLNNEKNRYVSRKIAKEILGIRNMTLLKLEKENKIEKGIKKNKKNFYMFLYVFICFYIYQ